MMNRLVAICCFLALAACFSSALEAQEKRLEKLQTGGGSASATQMSLWLAKEGNYYQKHGLNVEVISIPGSSLALQAMLSGELPIIQAGGAGPIQTSLSGADTVIIATIAKKFNWWIFSQPNITRMEDLKGKVFGTTRFGTQSDLASRIALRRYGIDPERDITMVQTGGPAETVSAMMTGKVHAAAITPPATLQAKKVKLRELLDLSKLDVEYHVNGLVTTRRFIKSNEDVVRRFLMAYIEGAARGQKDKPFAIKTMAKYFRSDDRELLEETYELIIKDGFSLPPYPAGVANLLQGLEAQYPKAKGAKPEDFVDSHFVRELEQNGFIKSVLAGK
jgi:NitT/TauT family transport system substrate-binding protein